MVKYIINIQTITHDLIKGGSEIPVNKKNLPYYITLFLQYYLKDQIINPTRWLKYGLTNQLSSEMSLFNPV